MSRIEYVSLPAVSPGTSRFLKFHRFGRRGARPYVYVQAGMHADELPANLVAHHLIPRLQAAEEAGLLKGSVTVVPVANPIGLDNVAMHDHQGRYHDRSGQNFNRLWPDVSHEVAASLKGKLVGDAEANVAMARAAIAQALAARGPGSEVEMLQLTLMREAAGADIVLDLHTDSEAAMHLYLDPEHWPRAADLAGLLDAAVVMTCRNSGDSPFEETMALPYIRLRASEGESAVPMPFTVVIELRGESDVTYDLASRDAVAITQFLALRGVIAGKAKRAPKFKGIAAPFEATEILRSPVGGIIVYQRELGEMVKPGDVIAEIVNPLAEGDAARVQVKTGTKGCLFTRSRHRLTWPGNPIAKIHGKERLAHRTGKLLTD